MVLLHDMIRPPHLTLSDLQRDARRRGGRCLSTEYKNNKHKLEWICRRGHRWQARAMNIRQGHWCPRCAGNAPRQIDDLKSLAARRGGRCLARRRTPANGLATWECSKGHRWQTRPRSIASGYWCPLCASDRPLTLEEVQATAMSRSGRCLSRSYRNCDDRLLWQCEHGHRWRARVEKIRRGTWCPECSRLRHRS